VFDNIIEALASGGLPTRFLKAISAPLEGLTVRTGDSNEYTPRTRTIELSSARQRGLQSVLENEGGMRPGPAWSTSSVASLYHESTHAYLDIYKNVASVQAFTKAGIAYYTGARLADGQTVSDPERVFQEAAASYVGERASEYFKARQTLSVAEAKFEGGDVTGARRLVGLARSQFNEASQDKNFGYQDVWDWSTRGYEQDAVTKPVSKELTNFLDATVLEGRIKANFDDNAEFSTVATKVEGAPQNGSH